MNLFELFAKISLDTSEYDDGISKSQKNTDSFAGKLKQGLTNAGKIGAAGIGVIAGAATAVTGSLLAVSSQTEEFSNSQAKLNTAFQVAGMSAEDASKAFNGFYSILGDTDTATEASQLLATLVDNEQDIEKWTDIAAGAYARFGDALPIEGLIESANETAKTGTVTGNLADALNWAGISEDDFNEKLSKCTSESERNRLIMDTLSDTYDDYSKQFKENNKELITSRKNQVELNKALSNLGKTISTIKNSFMNQFTPSVTEATKALSDMFNGVEGSQEKFSSAISSLISTAVNELPKFIEYGTNIIISIVQGLTESTPNLSSAVSSILQTISTAFSELLPNLGELGVNLIISIGNGIASALPDLVSGIVDGLIGIIGSAVENFDEILLMIGNLALSIAKSVVEGATDIISGLLEVFFGFESQTKKIDEQFQNALNSFTPFAEAVKNATPDAVNYSLAISKAGNSISDLDAKIRVTEDQITQVLKDAFREQGELRDEDIEDIKQYMEDYANLQLEKLEIFREQQRAELIKISQAKTEIEAEEAPKYIANVQAALDQANQAVEEAYTSKIAIIENLYSEEEKLTNSQYQTDLQNAKDNHDAQIAENQRYASEALSIIQEQSKNWIAEDAKKWEELSNLAELFSIDSENNFKNIVNKAGDFAGNYRVATNEYKKALTDMVDENSSAFLAMVVTAEENGLKLDQETLETADNMLSAFEGLPPGMDEAGKQALLSLISGLEDQIPGLGNAANMSADEIVGVLRKELGITQNSSTVTRSIGVNVGKGLENGINSRRSSIFSTVSSIASLISSAFSGSLGIHSPSKVFEKFGLNILQGLQNGIKAKKETKELENIVASIKNILDINAKELIGDIDDAYKQIINRIKSYNGELRNAENVSGSFFDSLKTDLDSSIDKFEEMISKIKEANQNYIDSGFGINNSNSGNNYLDSWESAIGNITSTINKGDSTIGVGISGMINSSNARYQSENNIKSVNLYLDDRTKLATWILDPLDKVTKANGTPIIRAGE